MTTMRTSALIDVDREKVRAKIHDLTAESEAISRRATHAGRDLTSGELERISRLAAGIDHQRAALADLDAEFKAWLDAAFRDPRSHGVTLEGPFGGVGVKHIPDATRDRKRWPEQTDPAWAAQFRGTALAALDANHAVLSAAAADRLETVIRTPEALPEARYIAAVADPDYMGAFTKLIRYGEWAKLRMTAAEEAAFDAVTAAQDGFRAAAPWGYTTGSTGGFALPFVLDPTLIDTSAGENCPLRRLARVQTLTQNAKHFVTTTGVVAVYAAEAAAMVEAGPTLAQPTLNAARGSAYITASLEMFADDPSLVQDMARLCATARDTLDATAFLTGSGTNEPLGIATIGTAGALTDTQRIQTISADVVAVGDPYAVLNAVPPRFAANASWVGSSGTYSFFYRLTPSGSTSEPQLIPAFGGPMLGRPYYNWSTMTTAAASGEQTDAIPLIVGDFREAVTIGDRLGGTVEVVPHVLDPTTGYPTGQRGILFWWRSGVVVHNPNALRFLEVK